MQALKLSSGVLGFVDRSGQTLERSPSGEPGVDVVPPFELVTFSELPAKENDPSVPK